VVPGDVGGGEEAAAVQDRTCLAESDQALLEPVAWPEKSEKFTPAALGWRSADARNRAPL